MIFVNRVNLQQVPIENQCLVVHFGSFIPNTYKTRMIYYGLLYLHGPTLRILKEKIVGQILQF